MGSIASEGGHKVTMAKSESKKAPPKSAKPADKTVAEAIGRQLRAVYDQTLSEPVPPELSDLIRRLSEKAEKERE